MGQLGGIVVAYLAVIVVVAVLAGIPQTVGGGLFRGIRWFLRLLDRDRLFALGMQMGFLALMVVMGLWHDNPLPTSVLGPMIFWPWIVLTLADLAVALWRARWTQASFLAAILVALIWDGNFLLGLLLVVALVALGILIELARVAHTRWLDDEKKRAGGR